MSSEEQEDLVGQQKQQMIFFQCLCWICVGLLFFLMCAAYLDTGVYDANGPCYHRLNGTVDGPCDRNHDPSVDGKPDGAWSSALIFIPVYLTFFCMALLALCLLLGFAVHAADEEDREAQHAASMEADELRQFMAAQQASMGDQQAAAEAGTAAGAGAGDEEAPAFEPVKE